MGDGARSLGTSIWCPVSVLPSLPPPLPSPAACKQASTASSFGLPIARASPGPSVAVAQSSPVAEARQAPPSRIALCASPATCTSPLMMSTSTPPTCPLKSNGSPSCTCCTSEVELTSRSRCRGRTCLRSQGKWLKACKRADDPSSSLRIVPSSASMSVPSISVSWYAARERLKTLDGSFAVTVAVRVDL